jgi:hypothetical protein
MDFASVLYLLLFTCLTFFDELSIVLLRIFSYFRQISPDPEANRTRIECKFNADPDPKHWVCYSLF